MGSAKSSRPPPRDACRDSESALHSAAAQKETSGTECLLQLARGHTRSFSGAEVIAATMMTTVYKPPNCLGHSSSGAPLCLAHVFLFISTLRTLGLMSHRACRAYICSKRLSAC